MENTTNNKKVNNSPFLLEEYNQCFSHMRHYDSLKLSLAKFGFSFYSAVAAISFGLERYFYYELKMKSVDLFIGLLLCLTFLMGLLIIVMMARYRKYFVQVARQVNGIRAYFFQSLKAQSAGPENLLYDDPNKPIVFNIKSTYLLLDFFFSLINGIALGFSAFLILRYFDLSSYLFIAVLIIVSFLAQLYYLKKKLQMVSL